MDARLFAFSVGLAALSAVSTAAAQSPGCGLPPPDALPERLVVEGEERRLIAALPLDYRPDRPHRLIVAFHGRTNPAEQVRRYYRLEGADDGRSIFVYPQALRQADGTFVWRLPTDAVLFDRIVEEFSQRYCIAQEEIFAVGHSLGASFVNSLACARGEVLRGIASVAGGIMAAECSGQVAALLLHNPEDELVPVEEGRAAIDTLLDQNALPPRPAGDYDSPYECQRYGDEDGAYPVVWCLYEQSHTRQGRYYPHLWPDGAEQAALDFFDSLEPPQALAGQN
ncbi:PHB depolymerase family esterase [Telmatospirillum sp. J64-1]|uniref:alpha/beta hydrolase family esterase n=1 Tax=Telmatospirillum sp. J64-1 TaxID=2502183 RepID=UPI00115C7139|nr:hypothetical protein [Telmatospirillum sp. J64-1]